MNEERFVLIVEEDLERIGRWVATQGQSLHIKLSVLLNNCRDLSYPVDYLRGESEKRAVSA